MENSLQNRFGSFISLFGLSAILKIPCIEHVHYVWLAAMPAWNREKQTFIAKGKDFDMDCKSQLRRQYISRSENEHEEKFEVTRLNSGYEEVADLTMNVKLVHHP